MNAINMKKLTVIHYFDVMKKKRRLGFLFATRDDIDDKIDFAELRNFECMS
jgi:hypothetical protein